MKSLFDILNVIERFAMENLVIQIGWPQFIGVVVTVSGSLIAIAWYSSGRFTALETSMKWVTNMLHDLKVGTENSNASAPAFGSGSPVNLKPTGEQWLNESGLKNYIDTHKKELMDICEEKRGTNPYEVQDHIFRAFDTLPLEAVFEDKLKKFAYEKGTSMSILRRVGAIYFRNLCLQNFGMNKEDIDKHDPLKKDVKG